jgi:hypothetical protein
VNCRSAFATVGRGLLGRSRKAARLRQRQLDIQPCCAGRTQLSYPACSRRIYPGQAASRSTAEFLELPFVCLLPEPWDGAFKTLLGAANR